jgi:catechol 2,3-dioxygenase
MKATHLAHAELVCADVEASREFLCDVFGLTEVARADGSIYLRCWGDWQSHSLILSPGARPAAAHLSFGVDDPAELPRVKELFEAKGVESWWEEDEPLQGQALRFDVGDGQVYELLADELRTPINEVSSRLHAQPLALRGVGIEPRRLDHCHIGTPAFDATSTLLREVLGFKIREQVNLPSGEALTHFLSVNSQVHDIAVRRANELEFHHVALWLDSREHMLRSAELLCHRGYPPEIGPGQHASTQAFFCHVLEPSGNRIEMFAAQYIVYEDWTPQQWTTEQKVSMERALGFCPTDLHRTMHREEEALKAVAG